LNDTITKVVL